MGGDTLESFKYRLMPPLRENKCVAIPADNFCCSWSGVGSDTCPEPVIETIYRSLVDHSNSSLETTSKVVYLVAPHQHLLATIPGLHLPAHLSVLYIGV